MRAGQTVQFLDAHRAAQPARIHAVAGTGPSGAKTLLLDTEDGERWFEVRYHRDAVEGEPCWALEDEPLPELTPVQPRPRTRKGPTPTARTRPLT